MPPALALVLWFVLLVGLFHFDPAKESDASVALWIPLVWVSIMASRLLSEWIGFGSRSGSQALEEGNPLDRAIFFLLMVLALAVLAMRGLNWAGFASRNVWLTAFILFAFISFVWSDFPLIALKRWFRDLGNYFVILVVLTDPNPLRAVRTLFRRLAYLLIPLSIVLDKYFPNLSRQFDAWTGMGMTVGVTTGKNLLGLLALLCGLFFFWEIAVRWANRKEGRSKRIIQLDSVFLLMCISLLITANSATCKVCMALGCFTILAARSSLFQRHPAMLKTLIPSIFCTYLVVSFGLGAAGNLAAAVGKDPTLTDRTKIWSFVLGMHTNPIIGTGYESFWLGPRLEYFWHHSGVGLLNEAHNGFLEIYLNLGLIGVFLISGFLLATYTKICKQFTDGDIVASFYLALWLIMLFYDVTEAGFRSGLMWLVFLVSGLSVPDRSQSHVNAGLMQRRPRNRAMKAAFETRKSSSLTHS